MAKMTFEQFAEKAVWEGGVLEYVIGYGVGPEEIGDPYLADLVASLKLVYSPVEDALARIEQYLEDQGVEQ